MKFVNTQYFTYALVAIVVIGILLNRLNAQYFNWVKTYWFYERTIKSRASTFCYVAGLFLMMTALLDLRGPEKKIKTNIPDQRTIILIDSSASMLSEDVRPSRFVKSLQLARHFVKNATGHQVSIVLFSDVQKRLIPFTDDIDLLDSRLAALEKTNSVAGGSNISQAIEEAIQYFEFDSNDDDRSKTGNMIIFTDAEESEGAFKVNMPPNVNLAVVGVGTLKGANIPLRWEDGSFRGYKTFKGEAVVTRLDENYIKKMGSNINSFKYWIANSYSLPTEEIINFLRTSFVSKQSKGDLRVRPVFSHYILIPAILLYCVSIFIGRFAQFKVGKNLTMILVVFFTFFTLPLSVKAEDDSENTTKVKITPEIKKDLELIKEGKASREYVLKTAEKLLKVKDDKRATELYSEYAKNNDTEEVRFNYATSLLRSNRLKDSLPIIQELLKNSKNDDLKEKLRKNLTSYLDQKKKQGKEDQQKKDDKKNSDESKKNEENKENKENKEGKDNKENKDNKDGREEKKGQNDKQQGPKTGQGGPEKDEQKNKDKEKENKEKKDKEKKDQEGKDKDGEGKDKDEEEKEAKSPGTIEEKEKEIEQKRRMTKTPAMIKQIMNDDRDLQKKMMDTSTIERGDQKPKRDW